MAGNNLLMTSSLSLNSTVHIINIQIHLCIHSQKIFKVAEAARNGEKKLWEYKKKETSMNKKFKSYPSFNSAAHWMKGRHFYDNIWAYFKI